MNKLLILLIATGLLLIAGCRHGRSHPEVIRKKHLRAFYNYRDYIKDKEKSVDDILCVLIYRSIIENSNILEIIVYRDGKAVCLTHESVYSDHKFTDEHVSYILQTKLNDGEMKLLKQLIKHPGHYLEKDFTRLFDKIPVCYYYFGTTTPERHIPERYRKHRTELTKLRNRIISKIDKTFFPDSVKNEYNDAVEFVIDRKLRKDIFAVLFRIAFVKSEGWKAIYEVVVLKNRKAYVIYHDYFYRSRHFAIADDTVKITSVTLSEKEFDELKVFLNAWTYQEKLSSIQAKKFTSKIPRDYLVFEDSGRFRKRCIIESIIGKGISKFNSENKE